MLMFPPRASEQLYFTLWQHCLKTLLKCKWAWIDKETFNQEIIWLQCQTVYCFGKNFEARANRTSLPPGGLTKLLLRFTFINVLIFLCKQFYSLHLFYVWLSLTLQYWVSFYKIFSLTFVLSDRSCCSLPSPHTSIDCTRRRHGNTGELQSIGLIRKSQ